MSQLSITSKQFVDNNNAEEITAKNNPIYAIKFNVMLLRQEAITTIDGLLYPVWRGSENEQWKLI